VKAADAMAEEVSHEVKFVNLRNAVRRLYYAAHWTPDRAVDAGALWTDVRDACGFPHGNSPTPQPFDGIRVEYATDRIRSMGILTRKQSSDPEFTTNQARAFLLLHGRELQDRLDKTVRDFLKEKL
jgi:hypothetical protein